METLKSTIKYLNSRDSDDSTAEVASPIGKFYAGRSILVTGATGFIGKVLIEKLLYSCPDVDKIYLLIRGAGGKSGHERMMDMISSKPFNIRLEQLLIRKKLIAIESDLSEHKLGLSDEDQRMLCDNISIIFHVAASVKFDAPLEVNMRHNVVATRELLDLGCNFKKLLCFVHVSTAYSNCQLRQIDERIYPMEVPEDLVSLQVTKEMIDNRPNTYTYTKAMAENVASKYANRMNVVIVRPSIVMSSIREPAEGWVDTINGPVGLSVLGALGILQKLKVNSEVVFDLIPVDTVSNALVSIAWAATEKRSEFLAGSSPSMAASDPNNNSSTHSGIPVKIRANQEETLAASCNGHKSAVALKIEELERSQKSVADHHHHHHHHHQQQQQQAISSTAANNQSLTKSQHFLHPQQVFKRVRSGSSISNKNDYTSNNLDGTVRVFNLTTGTENPCSFYNYFRIGREAAYKKPSTRALRPLLTIPKQKGMNPIQYWIHKIFSHLLFAYIADFILGSFGQKRMVLKAVNRMHHANEVFDFFCSNQWNFVTDNVKRLRELQTDTDRQVFDCDVRAIGWEHYAEIGWLGCRRFILKEEDGTFEYAKRRYRAICLVYYLIKIIFLLAATSLLRYSMSSQIVSSILLLPIYGVVYLL